MARSSHVREAIEQERLDDIYFTSECAQKTVACAPHALFHMHHGLFVSGGGSSNRCGEN